jgi:hypothetical protein
MDVFLWFLAVWTVGFLMGAGAHYVFRTKELKELREQLKEKL